MNERISGLNPSFESITVDTAVVKEWKAGQISFDSESLVPLLDTLIPGVRIQAGQEEYFLVWNDTAGTIPNGSPCFASGVDPTEKVLTIDIADNTDFEKSAQVLGLATHDIPKDTLGLVTWRGIVRDFDTRGLTSGLTYLGSGVLVTSKPLYPDVRIAMGALLKTGEFNGSFQVAISSLPRRSASRSYGFASADAAAGKHWRAGFYDWSDTSITLSQASLTANYGVTGLSRAAHVGIVPNGPGFVNTGQVGLQVTGTLDSETGAQIPAQTAIITDDITTLTVGVMEECLEKFSGEVTLSLYIVSGTPTGYSLTFNYGFSSYEDLRNIDATVTGFNAVWEAGAADSIFNVSLKFHTALGWTYAAAGFIPGNGNICSRLIDQGFESNISTSINGKYKRIDLSQFVNGSAKEGIIIEIDTGSTKSIRTMDLHVSAFSEELF